MDTWQVRSKSELGGQDTVIWKLPLVDFYQVVDAAKNMFMDARLPLVKKLIELHCWNSDTQCT